jgi:RNA polymerase sigma-70 factor (ECF subfamily)
MRSVPHDNVVQIGGQATMKADGSRKRGSNEYSKVEAHSNDARQQRRRAAFSTSEQATELTIHDVHDRMVKMLPRLRRFVGSLTGGAESSEDLIQETYARALAHLDQWQPGTRLDSWMFRIVQNLWIDYMRMQRFRGEAVDIEAIGDLLICDGAIIAENRVILQEMRKDIAQLSLDQRNILRLVCEYGMSYKETGEILNMPEGTVMSRLARARNALQKYL